MRFCCLGSGSRGNAFLVEHRATTLLVECGFSPSELRRRLGRYFVNPREIDAVLIGHEHRDHSAAVESLAADGIAIYMTAGTARALNFNGTQTIKSGTPFHIGDMDIFPITVPHDAEEPVQFVFNGRLGIFTDLGHITNAVRNACQNLEALVVECNYDAKILAANRRYPARIKERIRGKYGHLENGAAAALVKSVESPLLRHVVAAHISENNNAESSIRRALARVCDEKKITITDQRHGSDRNARLAKWLQLPAP